MKKLLLASFATVLATVIFLPAVADATPIPVTISLDNPNPSTPPSPAGYYILSFTGTINVASGWQVTNSSVDSPYNDSHSSFLYTVFDTGFLNWQSTNGMGSFTGVIFDVFVQSINPQGLYSLQQFSNALSQVTVSAQFIGGQFVDGGPVPFQASQAFSVLITDGSTNGVPEGGSSVLLLGASVVGLLSARRATKQS